MHLLWMGVASTDFPDSKRLFKTAILQTHNLLPEMVKLGVFWSQAGPYLPLHALHQGHRQKSPVTVRHQMPKSTGFTCRSPHCVRLL